MIRIRFPTDQDRVQGNYLLATKSVVRRLRGQIFEVSEAAASDRSLINSRALSTS